MKYWILALTTTLLLVTAADVHAHDLVTVHGKLQDHKHAYRRQEYGKPLQQGHVSRSANGHGVIQWGSDTRPAYGKSTAPRSGWIVGDRKPGRDVKPGESKQYGSAVSGYGKAVQGYGKPAGHK